MEYPSAQRSHDFGLLSYALYLNGIEQNDLENEGQDQLLTIPWQPHTNECIYVPLADLDFWQYILQTLTYIFNIVLCMASNVDSYRACLCDHFVTKA